MTVKSSMAAGSSAPSGRSRLRPAFGFGWLALFATIPTLFCCALPILFVTLGFGASWAALYASAPFIGMVATHKIWFFAASGLLLLVALWMAFRPGQSCPADSELAALCNGARKWNRRLILLAVAVWRTGFTAAYLALPIMEMLE